MNRKSEAWSKLDTVKNSKPYLHRRRESGQGREDKDTRKFRWPSDKANDKVWRVNDVECCADDDTNESTNKQAVVTPLLEVVPCMMYKLCIKLCREHSGEEWKKGQNMWWIVCVCVLEFNLRVCLFMCVLKRVVNRISQTDFVYNEMTNNSSRTHQFLCLCSAFDDLIVCLLALVIYDKLICLTWWPVRTLICLDLVEIILTWPILRVSRIRCL